MGAANSSGSFAPLRMTAKTKNNRKCKGRSNCRYEQQVLRCAKDDNRIQTNGFCWISDEVLLNASIPRPYNG
jgi:hypothetical protein